MKIDKVTITGPDNKTKYLDLIDLQEKYPFVEWGILFTGSKEGEQRYPSLAHREKEFIGVLNLSAHFCGWYARQVLEQQNFKLITELPSQYKRVQLNYNFKNSTGWNLNALLLFAQKCDRNIILQYNGSNRVNLDRWMEVNTIPENINFLYDASGGRGTEINDIRPPIGDMYTGYAGGIGIDNIDSICSEVGRVPNINTVWIDLESGARTDNEFDLDRVNRILYKCCYHIHR